MKITLKKTINLSLILEAFKEITYYENNSVHYNSPFRLYELKAILQSYINFPENISNISKNLIIDKTVGRIASLNYDSDKFETIINDELKNHLRTKRQKYFLLTSLSISSLPFRKIKINNSIITVKGKNFPKSFKENRYELLKKHHLKDNSENFIKIIVETESNEYSNAFKESLKNLDVLRAILNLSLNSNIEINYGSDIKQINKIRYGKYLTMHFENGETVNNYSYWWEPNFHNKIYELEKKNYEGLNKVVKWHLNRITKSKEKFKKSIIYCLNLYVNAFDEPNKQNCFLKIWTALETLLSTHQNDLIVKRCVTIYEEEYRPMQKQIIGAIKDYRNDFVHEGIEASRENLTTYCFKIQSFIRNILRYNHLQFYSSFDNIEQANIFLDKRRVGYYQQKKEIEMLRIIEKKINTKS
tara:strand:- start:95 stop:1339 length:1245 start_codon:yes stop_codon:yes gene_type:complete